MNRGRNKDVFFLAMFFCGVQQIFAGSVTISLAGARSEDRNAQGAAVYEVDPGQKFKVLVVSSGQETITSRPDVPGLSSFKTLSTSQSSNMVSINGRITNTIKFEYYLLGEDEGEAILGPVTTPHGTSAPCTIRVRQRSQQEAYKDFEKEYNNGAQCQVQLSVDKKTFYVGEHIPVTAQIYCWDSEVEVEGIQPHFEGFSFQEGASGSTEMELHGKKVRVLTKKYVLTSLWAGEKKIKPVSVQYIAPSEDFDDFMFRSSMFFGPSKMVNRQEIQSNGLEIEIKNLPNSSRTSDGLGKFSSLLLSVDKNIVDVKSLINVSLKVVGRGNFSQVSAPRLKLPKSIRAFPGSTEGDLIKREDNSGDFEKKFTYVIQPLKPGTITIPAQEFFYFDPDDQQYRTLTSRELTIVVEGDEQAAPQESSVQEVETKKTVQTKVAPAPKEAVDEWASEHMVRRSWAFNWHLWLVLAALLIGLGLAYERLMAWSARRRKNPKRALELALRSLANLKNKTPSALFEVAMEFLRLRFFGARQKHLSLEEIDQELECSGMKPDRRADFMQFLTLLAGLAFGSVKTQKNYDQLVTDLQKWLTELHQYFRG